MVSYFFKVGSLAVLGFIFPKVSFYVGILLFAIYYSQFVFLLKWEFNYELLYYFQKNLCYFLGFGLIYSIITNIFSSAILNDSIYYFFFPIFILNSTNAEPPIIDNI